MDTSNVPVERTTLRAGPYRTYLYRARAGREPAVLFLLGSGPGVSAWANWQFALPALGQRFDCLAPDLVGFGQSEHPDPPLQGMDAWMRAWLEQLIALLDLVGIERAHVVGNSMGGAIALHLLWRHPERVRSAVLMGTIGVPFQITPGLDGTWGFYDEPTLERLTQIFRWFVYDPERVGGDLEAIARQRYESTQEPNARRSFAAMFPAPRQRHLDELVVPDDALVSIQQRVLLVHGRDDQIIPLDTSLYLLQRLPRVQLHVFGQCSHWTQIEYRDAFNRLIADFIAGEL
uniref:Alpha/beta fold hydrolase n=1 Tax=Thermorudis peleae TaxID=1382356 RepID=A0A831X9Z2_9BACT